jgi:hypothetical protein
VPHKQTKNWSHIFIQSSVIDGLRWTQQVQETTTTAPSKPEDDANIKSWICINYWKMLWTYVFCIYLQPCRQSSLFLVTYLNTNLLQNRTKHWIHTYIGMHRYVFGFKHAQKYFWISRFVHDKRSTTKKSTGDKVPEKRICNFLNRQCRTQSILIYWNK